ncbi:hypothetical protein B0T26DRAFT_712765 [Lasiosphaeria miniovina]|uniref:RNA helicase n=1 Tax=Lasiosphaeria miniovina TaxID=1954250 RepID=A0AA40AM36_9PEZI|nr:uncharacterized protein B0T26DRAFT_712765 [Lasiosphaeria miniovina]KAK0718305.1 hypothetical protein B0T26DRAFT_712765 [Lasiosphaeria miniovina]
MKLLFRRAATVGACRLPRAVGISRVSRCFRSTTTTITARAPTVSSARNVGRGRGEFGSLREELDNDKETPRRNRQPKPSSKRNYELLQAFILSRLTSILETAQQTGGNGIQLASFGVTSVQQLKAEANLFRAAINKSFALAIERGVTGRHENPLFWNLRYAFIKYDAPGMTTELKHSFQTFLLRSAFPKALVEKHTEIADMRFPYEWFPASRMLQRTIHLHVGPTNSGKTYNALKALEAAKTGVYAGPLRLLAHEIYSRFNAKGKPCALVTGEEQRIPENVDDYFVSCTVEMSPLNRVVDVAVIDEIQMIADDYRGWAWTQAFLGLQAKELHLCGEERAVDLIQELCARTGDKCIVHHYERLNPLKTMGRSLRGDFRNLENGDAVVSFSRVNIHALKQSIEQKTGHRCAIVYGSLPPETRAQQAALFNDPNNNYNYLVASDAIGMGLNLEIKRVVFEAASKFDGMGHRSLTVSEIKQIGGRAGRYKTARGEIADAEKAKSKAAASQSNGDAGPVVVAAQSPPAHIKSIGYVTSLLEEELPAIQEAFKSTAKPLKRAGIMPPSFLIEKFAATFSPKTPLSFILTRLRELSRVSELFEICQLKDTVAIADFIHEFDLTMQDRCIFLSAPCELRTPSQVRTLKAFARCVAELKGGHLLDIPEIDLDALLPTRTPNLTQLEGLHKDITLYLWLSYRFRGIFTSQHLAFHVKSLVEAKINEALEGLHWRFNSLAQRRKMVKRYTKMQQKRESMFMSEEEIDDVLEGIEVPLFEGEAEAGAFEAEVDSVVPRDDGPRKKAVPA